jgi:hypothetical protein
MADNNDLFKERKRIISEIKQLQKDIQSSTSDSEKLDKRKNELAKQLLETNKQIRDSQLEINAEQFNATKSLSSLYSNLTNLERERIYTANNRLTIDDEHLITAGKIADLNRELAQLSEEDDLQKRLINQQIEEQLTSLSAVAEANASQRDDIEAMVENLKIQNNLANNYSELTKYQKDLLESQLQVYDGIKKSIGGVLDTVSLLISNTTAGIGLATIAAGKFVGKLGEVRSQLGGIVEFGTTAISFIDPNAVENAKELASQFGGIDNISGSLQVSTSLISANMGISGTEAAGLLGSFSRLNGNSEDTALNLTKATQQFAKQNGVIPSAVMQDLASATEEFALYGKEGGKNLIEAATYARKLGTNLKTVTAIGDSLLDFETSITKELEASAILGRNINMNKARGLFYAGKETEAMQEVLRVVGGLDEFNKMDRFSKRAVADLLGIQADELQRMLANQENANELAGTLAGKFSVAGEALQAGLNKYLGVTVQGLGGALIAIGQMGTGLNQLGGIGKKALSFIGRLGGGGGPSNPITETVENLTEQSGNLSNFTKNLNPAGMIKGAVAIAILAAAIGIAGIGFQQFADVEWPAVAMGLTAIAGLTIAAMALGKVKAMVIKGAIAIAILGGAMIPLGHGLSLITPLVNALGTVIVNVLGLITPLVNTLGTIIINAMGQLPPIIDSVSNGIVNIMNTLTLERAASLIVAAGGFLALAGGITVLAASLAMLANPASMIGLGVLAGVSALAGSSILLMKELGIIGDDSDESSSGIDNPKTMDSGYQKSMLSKMDMLIELSKTDRNIYIDGEKITTIISKNNNKITRNEGVNLYTN